MTELHAHRTAATRLGLIEAAQSQTATNGRAAKIVSEIPRQLVAPLSIGELIALDEPEDDYLIEPIVPMMGNLLIGAYPKSYKTWLLLLMAISIATGKPFLGRFNVPQRRKVGLVLMEDRHHRVRRRLARLCLGLGLTMDDIDGWLYLWFRPPHFKLNNPAIMAEMKSFVAEYELAMLGIDNWVNVSVGNQDKTDVVMPQLDAFRDACAPNCTPVLVHHAKKTGADSTDDLRLTDIIRNSGDLSGWYDTGIVLTRKNESSPVKFRMEMRDDQPIDPFAFTLVDEYPRTATEKKASGWVKLEVSDTSPAMLDRQVSAEKLVPILLEHLKKNPGCSKRSLRSLPGDNTIIDVAFKIACDAGQARFEAPIGKGGQAKCYLV